VGSRRKPDARDTHFVKGGRGDRADGRDGWAVTGSGMCCLQKRGGERGLMARHFQWNDQGINGRGGKKRGGDDRAEVGSDLRRKERETKKGFRQFASEAVGKAVV